MYKRCRYEGFSFLELLLVMAIMAFVVTLGVPSVLEAQRSSIHKGAVESAYFNFKYAKSAAISTSSDITVSFVAGNNWCMGVSNAGQCDCQTANACQVDGVERVLRAADYPNLTIEDVNFQGNTFATFDSQRGMSQNSAGSFEITQGDNEARLTLNPSGRVSICVSKGTLGSYSAC